MKFFYRRGVEHDIARSSSMHRELEKRGKRIADETETQSLMASAQPGRYGEITVDVELEKVVVVAQGPLAHLDEWGSSNNAPTAAMRKAAASQGKFRESRS